MIQDPEEPIEEGSMEFPSPLLEDEADREAGAPPKRAWREKLLSLPGVLALFVVVVVVSSAAALLALRPLKLGGLVIMQLFGVLGPSLLFLKMSGRRWREVLSWNAPEPRAMLGAFLLGSSVWLLASLSILPLQEKLLPIPEDFLGAREELFATPDSPLGWLVLWLAAALTPAICEEILFRGLVLRAALEHLKPTVALLTVSLLFAIFHGNVYQLIVTFLLGLILGWLVIQGRSIFPAMLFHLTNNSMVLFAAGIEEADLSSWMLVLPLLAAGAGGLLVISNRVQPE